MLIHEQLKIHRLQLPIPFHKYVNVYAIQGADGWALVDTGLSKHPIWTAWQSFFDDHQLPASAIRGIYATHRHSDHLGAAGWLQQRTGAPVYLSSIDKVSCQTFRQGDYRIITESYRKNAMPEEFIDGIPIFLDSWRSSNEPFAEMTVLEPGATVRLGDFPYAVLATPGHSDGHMCFFNEQYGVLLSGDHLLPHITPHIGLYPQSAPDPLGNYLQSLQTNRSLPCSLVLPAHGDPFTGYTQRVDATRVFHQERLALMKGCLGYGATVYAVSCKVFGADLDLFNCYLGMAETYAHLMYLVYRGEVKLEERDGLNIFIDSPSH